MTVHEAWERARERAGDEAAKLALIEDLEQRSFSRRVVAAHRADAVSRATLNLLSRVRDGDLPELSPAQVGAYLTTMVVNASVDLLRKEQRQQRIAEKATAAAVEDLRQQAEREVPDASWGTLETVFERALTLRDSWQRPHLQKAWAQVKRLHLENVTLRDLLVEEHPEYRDDSAELNAAVERAYKAHTRLRAALVSAAEALARAGRQDVDPAAVREVVGRLRRRQPRSPVRSAPEPASSTAWSPKQ